MEVEASTLAVCTAECHSPLASLERDSEVVQGTLSEAPVAPVESTVDDSKRESIICLETSAVQSVQESEQVAPQEPPAPVCAEPQAVETADPSSNDVGKYKLIRTIGKGNFAKVKLAIHMATGVEVAIKIINKTKMDSTLIGRLKREISIMKVTNHPNIVRLLEIIENEDVLCLVMEYACGGEIFDYLVSKGRMREREARAKFRQLLSAVQYCHSKRIVHRDLKAENILLDAHLNVKVADFGLANTFDLDQRLTTFCGSPPYAAPELFLGIPYFGPGVDVWSLGVILFTLVLGHLPFDARDLRELRSKIIGLNYTIPRNTISVECEALLKKMLVLDPRDRSSLKSLMRDKWVNMGYAPEAILRPYKEPPRHKLDEVRVRAMETMGFTRADLEASVVNPEYDHVYATYHLLPETPSPYILLYERLLRDSTEPAMPEVSLPDSLVVSELRTLHIETVGPTKQMTSVGRFTVAPAGVVAVPVGPTEVKVVLPPLSPAQDRPAGFPPSTDVSPREHHSLTSALPVALKRAFAQMGRTFGGANTSVTSGHNDTSPRTGGGRVSTKPYVRTIDDRCIITAAPVPITTGKRPSATTKHPKHISPKQFSPKTSTAGPRSGSSDSTPVANTARGTSMTHAAEVATAGTSRSSASKAQRQRKKHSKPSSFNKVSQPPNSPRVSGRVPVNPPSGEDPPCSSKRSDKSVCSKSSRHTTDSEAPLDCKSVMSSTTSSDSYTVYSRKSSASVHNMWLTNEPTAQAASVSAGIPSSSSVMEGLAVRTNEETSTPIRHPSAVADPTTHPSVDVKSLEDGRHSLTTSRTHSKTCAAQSGKAEVHFQTPMPATTAHTVSGTHTSTWTRGVFKVLGGLFVSKSHENPDASLKYPREVRFPWSVQTTSGKSADEVLQGIIAALESTPGCCYSFDQHFPYLLRCSWASGRGAIRSTVATSANTATINPIHDTPAATPAESASSYQSAFRGDPLHWEMEVCQLPHMHLRGVRLRRIRGSAVLFRQIADSIMNSLHL